MNGDVNYIQHLNTLLNPKNEDDIDDDDVSEFKRIIYEILLYLYLNVIAMTDDTMGSKLFYKLFMVI